MSNRENIEEIYEGKLSYFLKTCAGRQGTRLQDLCIQLCVNLTLKE